MNKREKEVLGSYLDDEKKTLNYLKQVYKKSAEDIRERIAYFNAREDMNDPHLSSIIYQKQYQRVLLKEIEAGLKDLNENQYKSLQEFFEGSYVNGYVGAMYNFEGQGIPLTVPIDPKKMVRAVQTDSKLSRRYYQKRLFPENVERLKLSIKAEVSRGIASGSSWLEVAHKVASGMNSPFDRALNDAVRIVRTEGHRINQEGYLDAGDEAKKKGADILKQWDATLDSRTRPWHQEADGQIREWEDDFTVNGEKMKAPSVGGSASNVINCRCQLLQRARWALDEDELKTLEERANFYGLDKSKDFEDFKQKYLKLPEEKEQTSIFDPVKSGDEAEIRKHLGETKKEFEEKSSKLADSENQLKIIKEAEEDWKLRIKPFSDHKGRIQEKLDFYNQNPEIWDEEIIRMQFIKDHFDEFENGSLDSLRDPIKEDIKNWRKEVRRLQKILDADYDELERIIGKINVGDDLVKKYGDKHCKQIRNFLLDASDEDRKLWLDCSDKFHALEQTPKGRKNRTGAYYTSFEDGVWLSINPVSKGNEFETPYQTLFHEYGHHADYILNRKYGNGDRRKSFSELFNGGIFEKTIKEEANEAIEKFAKDKGLLSLPNKGTVVHEADKMVWRGLLLPSEKTDWVKKQLQTMTVDRVEAEKQFCEHMKKTLSPRERSDISDMFESSMKTVNYPFGFGHGGGYWGTGKNAKEAFAEMYSSRMSNKESYKQIQKYFPNSVKIFEEMLKVVK